MLQTSLSKSRRTTPFNFATDSFVINAIEYKYKKLVLFEEKENSESWICLVTQPKMDLILLLSIFSLASGSGNEGCQTSGGNDLNKLLGCLTSMRRTFDAEVNTTLPSSPSAHGRGGAFSNLMSNIQPRKSDHSDDNTDDENVIERAQKKIVTVNEWSYVFPWRASCSLEALLGKQQRLVPYYVANSSSFADLHPSSGRSSPSLDSTADTERPNSAPDFKNKPLCDEVVRHVARQLAERIKWIHQHGIAHGAIDLKNISLTPNLSVLWAPSYTSTQDAEDGGAGIGKKPVRDTRWLPPEYFYDFSGVSVDTISGLSGTMESPPFPLSSSISSPTSTSPRQSATPPFPRERSSDIWSFGCVLLSLTLAQVPFPNDDDDALIQTKLKLLAGKHVVDQKRYDVSIFGNEVVEELIGAPLASLGSRFPGSEGINPDLLDLIRRCVSVHPLSRPTANDILAHPFLSGGEPFRCTDFICCGEEANDPLTNMPQALRQRVHDAFVKEARLPISAVSLVCKNAWLLRSMASLHHTRRALMKKREKDLEVRNLETMSRVNEPLPKWDVYVFVCRELIPFLSTEYTITPMFIHESYCLHKDEELHERSVLWAMMVAELVPQREPHFMLHQQLSNHGMRGNAGGMRRKFEAFRARITGHPSSSLIPLHLPLGAGPPGYPTLTSPSALTAGSGRLEDPNPAFMSGIQSVHLTLPQAETHTLGMTAFGSGWMMGDGYAGLSTFPNDLSGVSVGGGCASPFLLPPPRQNVRQDARVAELSSTSWSAGGGGGGGVVPPLLLADRSSTSHGGTVDGGSLRRHRSSSYGHHHHTIMSINSKSLRNNSPGSSLGGVGGGADAILLLTPAEEGHGPNTNRKRRNPLLYPYEENAVPDIEYLEPSIVLSFCDLDHVPAVEQSSMERGEGGKEGSWEWYSRTTPHGMNHDTPLPGAQGRGSSVSGGLASSPSLMAAYRSRESGVHGMGNEMPDPRYQCDRGHPNIVVAASSSSRVTTGSSAAGECGAVDRETSVPEKQTAVEVVFMEQGSNDERRRVWSNLRTVHYAYDSLRRPIASVDPRGKHIWIAVSVVVATAVFMVLAAVLVSVL